MEQTITHAFELFMAGLFLFVFCVILSVAISEKRNLRWQQSTGYAVTCKSTPGVGNGIELRYEEGSDGLLFLSRDSIGRLPSENLWQQIMPAFVMNRRAEIVKRLRERTSVNNVTFLETDQRTVLSAIDTYKRESSL